MGGKGECIFEINDKHKEQQKDKDKGVKNDIKIIKYKERLRKCGSFFFYSVFEPILLSDIGRC